MDCEKCGEELTQGKKFCTHCGAPAPDSQAGPTEPQAPTPPAPAQSAAPAHAPSTVMPSAVVPVAASSRPKGRLADKGTGWKVLAGVLALLILAGIVVGIVFIVKAVSGGGKPVARISQVTLTRKDGKKLDMKKVPLGVDMDITAYFTASYPQGGRGTLRIHVEDESGEEILGDTFEVKSSGGQQKQKMELYMTAGSGKPVKAVAKLSVTSGTGTRVSDEKTLTYTVEEGNLEEEEEQNTDSELEQARSNVQADFDDLITIAEDADAAGIDLSDLFEELEQISNDINDATTIEELDALATRIAEIKQDIEGRFVE